MCTKDFYPYYLHPILQTSRTTIIIERSITDSILKVKLQYNLETADDVINCSFLQSNLQFYWNINSNFTSIKR